MPKAQRFQKLPAPWDRIFSLGTRTFVWGLLIGIIYILRPFFLMIFLTFVFAYIQDHGAEGLQHRIKNRMARVILVFVMLLSAIVGTGYFIGPRMKQQADDFRRNYPTYFEDADNAIWDFAEGIPALEQLLRDSARSSQLETPGPQDNADKGETKNGKSNGTQPDKNQDPVAKPQEPLRPPILQPLAEELFRDGGKTKGSLKGAFATLQGWVGVAWGFGSSFFLSLLFSFLIVLDLPKLTRQVQGLANTKIGFIYTEVAENIRDFARVVGRALEAQLFIAITNTMLTGIGIYFMDLPPLAFLCTIVMLTKFRAIQTCLAVRELQATGREQHRNHLDPNMPGV